MSTKQPRILVLTSTYPRWKDDHEPGFVHELARRLTDRFDVHVLAPHAFGAKQKEIFDEVNVCRFRYAPGRLETLVNDGGIVNNLKLHNWKWLLLPGFFLALAFSTLQQIRRLQPDVVHAHWLIPQGLVMAALSIIQKTPPFVITSHGADLFALRSRLFIALKRFTTRRAAAITVVSSAMVDELHLIGVDKKKIRVRPMGVDLRTRFTLDSSVERSKYEILFVGRLVEKKGVRHLISALPEVLKAHPETRLLIAGYGPEERKLRQQIKQLGLHSKVNFLGAVSQHELPALYHRAALFVAPFIEARGGDQEGLGLVTIEAIGSGCPAIISELETTRALPARKVPPGNPKALAIAIIDFFQSNTCQRIAEAGEQRNKVEIFDWQSVTDSYYNILCDQVR